MPNPQHPKIRDPIDWKAGDRCNHTIFGNGTVKEYKPYSNHPVDGGSIVIAFDDHGAKELQLSFAGDKLTRIPRRGEKA